jgi:SAM-dependent methyltransferase
MYSKSQKYYDEIYAAEGKDYPAEANIVHKLIQKYRKSTGKALLDVGCGTGIHANLLSRHYQVQGLDLDKKMLAVARGNYPQIKFQQGDMVNFQLINKFDVIVSLFSAIGYARTKTRLHRTIKNMSQHLASGGVLLIEPWFTPEQWFPGRVYTLQVDKPDLKIIRMSHSSQKGKISIIQFEYLIGTPKGVERDTEFLELGLFTKDEYLEAFQSAGLKTIHNAKGVDGRGLYIGIKP